MTVHTASVLLAWVIVGLVMAGAITAVLIRRTAGRLLAVALTGMLVLGVVTVRQEVDDIRRHHQAALCAGNAALLGVSFTPGDSDCPQPG